MIDLTAFLRIKSPLGRSTCVELLDEHKDIPQMSLFPQECKHFLELPQQRKNNFINFQKEKQIQVHQLGALFPTFREN